MEPEVITPAPEGNKINILIILVASVLVIVGAVAGYLFMQKYTPPPVAEVAPVVQKNKISDRDFSKLQILQDLMAQAPVDSVSQEEKLRILKNLQTKTPVTKASDAERLRILQSIAVK